MQDYLFAPSKQTGKHGFVNALTKFTFDPFSIKVQAPNSGEQITSPPMMQ